MIIVTIYRNMILSKCHLTFIGNLCRIQLMQLLSGRHHALLLEV